MIRNHPVSLKAVPPSLKMRKFEGSRPDFEDPPVVEVVLGMQFKALNALGAVQVGALWDRYRDDYPITEERPPLRSVIESFEPPRPRTINVEVAQDSLPVRYWFKNVGDTGLIQVQRDRFIYNWKKSNPADSYPRYEFVRQQFVESHGIFLDFVKTIEIGEVIPVQCEVTYINHIFPCSVWREFGQLSRIFSVWSGRHSDGFLGPAEDINFQTRYRILDDDNQPIGRLNVDVEPRVNLNDGSPMVRLALTARGAPAGQNLDGVLEFLNLGREYVVRGFASLTSKKMHEIWRRIDAK